MKKFFGIGLLALLTTAYFTSSCSRDDLSGSLLEAKKATFNDNFIAEYGNIAPNHDWGFGIDNGTRAFTRAFSNYLNQSGANKNINQWGDPTMYNLQVPPELTDGQKERVRKYFQTHKPLTYVDPGYTHFFIQQVYKGGTSPANDPIMGNYTTEQYVMADANVNNGVYQETVGSSKMDYLTVGLDANGNCLHHVNDFNNGEWGNGQAAWILNEGEDTNNHANWDNGHVHQDKITLVINSNTRKVGYANSDDSQQHNNVCALVNPKDIDDWANAQSSVIGENVYYNIYDTDGNVVIDNQRWKRSFVGLDFEGYDPYVYDNNGQKVVAKVGDVTNSVKFVYNGTRYYVFDAVKTMTLKQMLGLQKEIYYLGTNISRYAGKSSHFNSQSDIESQVSKDVISTSLLGNGYTQAQIDAMGINNTEKVLDLTKIQPKIDANCMPREGESFMKWYSDFEDRGRDGIYSDWIVTLTKAKEQGDTSSDDEDEIVLLQSGRVFCEDLGSVGATDIDYNDVVFDAWLYVKRTNNDPNTDVFYKAFIQPLAAGGTISAQIAGVDVHKTLFGVENDVMVNTYKEGASNLNSAAKHCEYGANGYNTMPSKIVITRSALLTGPNGEINIKYIPIAARTSGNVAVELTSISATDAPLKFMAPLGTPWAAERVKFGTAYTGFMDWVGDRNKTPWSTGQSSLVCNIESVPPTDAEIKAPVIDTNGNGVVVTGNTPTTPTTPQDNNPTAPTVTGPTGHEATWSGTQAFTVNADGSWSGNVSFDSNSLAFNNMGNGTYIRIYGYGTSNDWQVQLAHQLNQEPWTWTELTSYQQTGTNVNTSTTIEFGPLSAEEAQAIKDDGRLYVHGKNFVVKYIDIDNSGVQQPTDDDTPTPSWTGNEQLGWWPGVDIPASVFRGLAVRDVVRFTGEGEKGLQVQIYKTTDTSATLDVGWPGLNGGGIEVNNEDYDNNYHGYVQFTVSESNIDEITTNGFNVRGLKFTLKAITIIKK